MAEYKTVTVKASISDASFTASANVSDMTIRATAGISTLLERVNVPTYQGSYDVTPDWSAQTLETTDKLMTDDVRIASIQLESVSNTSGGRTVYIGGIL